MIPIKPLVYLAIVMSLVGVFYYLMETSKKLGENTVIAETAVQTLENYKVQIRENANELKTLVEEVQQVRESNEKFEEVLDKEPDRLGNILSNDTGAKMLLTRINKGTEDVFQKLEDITK
jgi:uncharacterized membrane protein